MDYFNHQRESKQKKKMQEEKKNKLTSVSFIQ